MNSLTSDQIIQEMMEENGEVIIDMKQSHLTIQITHQQMTEDEEIHKDTEEEEIYQDIKELTEIKEDGLYSPSCCIYRVPPMIRRLKEEAYTPQVVSIGPFHHGDVRLKVMERHKHIMFKRFVQRAMTNLESLVNFAKLSEPEVRASYSESVNYGKKDLVKLMLVDAAFIIQVFIMDNGGSVFQYFEDAQLQQVRLYVAVRDDLLLLENQLPFIFLEKLYDIAFPRNRRGDLPSFLDLTYLFFKCLNTQDLAPDPQIKHFTDLLRSFYLPTARERRDMVKGDGSDILLYSAKELKEAGVKFKGIKTNCLLDLKFSGSLLVIPQIIVEDVTETLFRNIIALEQRHYGYTSYFTDYTFLMDSLINTSEDVEILGDEKIIRNWLSDANEVAALFNGLGKNIEQPNFNVGYVDICKRLNEFYHNPCNKRKATLRRDYFKTPWQTVASIAGIVLLILTLIQTIFSILQVVLPN